MRRNSSKVIARAQSARSNLDFKTRLLRRSAPRNDVRTAQDFLLEIGCEELPADYLPEVLSWNQGFGFGVGAALSLTGNGVKWKRLQSCGTPRRLALLVEGVEPFVQKIEKGPPVQVAFDAQGKPTRAAEAFAERHRLKISQLTRRETPRGIALFAEYDKPVSQVLQEIIPEVIQRIPFPKTMRWDNSGVGFARPIRWLLSLYGARPVNISLGKVISGNLTYGARRRGARPVIVRDAKEYFSVMKRLDVLLEQGQGFVPHPTVEGGLPLPEPFLRTPKRELIRRQLKQMAGRLGGRLPDETTEEFGWLLNTVTFLAEDPVVAAGSFQPEYLELPPEVLATAMAKHLKLFSIFAPDGKRLLPRFLAVLEGKPGEAAMVMSNIERILEARFTDARFFYKADTKGSLEAKVPELATVVFHEKLGSVADRIPRLERLMKGMAGALSLADPPPRELERAARLCKADLVTQLVREFPSLQGIVGGHYARGGGEPEEFAQAISQQYRPRAANDSGPSSPLGALIGLADRIDTLIGYFGIGLRPTGSADPYGLRRQALGLVRILIEPPPGVSFVGLSIDSIFDEGIQSWGLRLTVDPKTLKRELGAFLRERVEWLAFVQHKIDRELIAAVLAAETDDLAGCWERLKILQELWKDPKRKPALIKAAKVAERTGRIVRAAKQAEGFGAVNPGVFKEPSEKKLWEIWNQVSPQIEEQVNRRQYEQAVATYSALYPEVHGFFETVFVMDENPEIRKNRLAFMKEIFESLSGRFADLSKLPLAGIEP